MRDALTYPADPHVDFVARHSARMTLGMADLPIIKFEPLTGFAHLTIGGLKRSRCEGFKKHEHFRTGRRVNARTRQADFGFPVVVGLAVRYLASERVGLSRCAKPGPSRARTTIRAADSRAVAAVGSADCAISGFACGADPRGVHVSRRNRRGRPMGAIAS